MIEIVREEHGPTHAANNEIAVTVLPDGAHNVFKRRAIKMFTSGAPTQHVEWLVCEINGVRLYIHGRQIIMTTQDLNP